MKYLDANILFPMFALSARRRKNFKEEGSTGSLICDFGLNLIGEMDEGITRCLISDLVLLETSSVVSRDTDPDKAALLVQAVLSQKGLEIFYTPDIAWIVAQSLVLQTAIEARDSLHLANCLLINLIQELLTCDKDFYEKATEFARTSRTFTIPSIVVELFTIDLESKSGIEEAVNKRKRSLTLSLVPM
jgi:hypothetical protein